MVSFKDDFNSKKGGFPEGGGTNVTEEIMELLVSEVSIQTGTGQDGTNYDYLNIVLVNDKKEKIEARQTINYDNNGLPKNLVWPTFKIKAGVDQGKEIPASVVYDIMHLAKDLDETIYQSKVDEAKKKHGEVWIGKDFLEGLLFKIGVRRIKKDTEEYLIPVFTKQLFDDEKRKQDAEVNKKYSAKREENKDVIDPDDLPF